MGFEGALAQFEALNAQVVGVSADHAATLEAFTSRTASSTCSSPTSVARCSLPTTRW